MVQGSTGQIKPSAGGDNTAQAGAHVGGLGAMGAQGWDARGADCKAHRQQQWSPPHAMGSQGMWDPPHPIAAALGEAGVLSLAPVHVGCWQGTSGSTGQPTHPQQHPGEAPLGIPAAAQPC